MSSATALIIVALMGGILFGFFLGIAIQDSFWKKLCIRKGFARYNETTGKWEWKP